MTTTPFGMPKRQRGFTLIELMISITIGLVILAALVGVLAANNGQSQANDRTSELSTNGRFALNTLKQELRQAGYRGYTKADPTAPGTLGVPTSPTANICFEAGSSYEAFVSNIAQGIWGANNSNPFSANCIATAKYATGNDVLLVRRISGTPITTLVANTVYFHSSYAQGQMFRGTVVPTFNAFNTATDFLANFQVLEYVYYICPYTLSATESPLVPSLRRMGLDSTGKMVDELVASGIEHLQVQYGLQDTSLNTRYLDASAVSGGSADSTSTAGYQWDGVNTVQIWLLARNAVVEPGYSNTQTYVMGDATVTKSDGYRRQLFSTVVQLRN